MTRPRSWRPSAVLARHACCAACATAMSSASAAARPSTRSSTPPNPKARYDVVVVPATGGVQGRYHTDVNVLASELAARLGGQAYQLHAPIFVDTPEEKQALLNVRQIREVIERARQRGYRRSWAWVASSRGPRASSTCSRRATSERDRSHRRPAGPRRAVRARLRRGRRDPARRSSRAGSSASTSTTCAACRSASASRPAARRWHPSAACLRGGYLKTLVTDEPTAFSLLDVTDHARQRGSERDADTTIRQIRHRGLGHRPRHVGHRGLDVGRRRRARFHRGDPGVHRRGRDAHRHGSRVRLRALRGDRRARPSRAVGTRSSCPRSAGWSGTPTEAGTSSMPRVTSSIATSAATRSQREIEASLRRLRHRRHRHLRHALAGPHDPHRGDDGCARGPQGSRQDPGHRRQQRHPGRRPAEYLAPRSARRHPGALQRAGPRARGRARPDSASSAASRSCRTPRSRWASCRARSRPSASSRATTSARTNPRYSPENRAQAGRDRCSGSIHSARSSASRPRSWSSPGRWPDPASPTPSVAPGRRPTPSRTRRPGRCELSAEAIAAIDDVLDDARLRGLA